MPNLVICLTILRFALFRPRDPPTTNFTPPFGKSDTYYMSTYHAKPPFSNGIGPISMQSNLFRIITNLKVLFFSKSPGIAKIYCIIFYNIYTYSIIAFHNEGEIPLNNEVENLKLHYIYSYYTTPGMNVVRKAVSLPWLRYHGMFAFPRMKGFRELRRHF